MGWPRRVGRYKLRVVWCVGILKWSWKNYTPWKTEQVWQFFVTVLGCFFCPLIWAQKSHHFPSFGSSCFMVCCVPSFQHKNSPQQKTWNTKRNQGILWHIPWYLSDVVEHRNSQQHNVNIMCFFHKMPATKRLVFPGMFSPSTAKMKVYPEIKYSKNMYILVVTLEPWLSWMYCWGTTPEPVDHLGNQRFKDQNLHRHPFNIRCWYV